MGIQHQCGVPHTSSGSMGTSITFHAIDDASRAFAAWLQKVATLQRGDRVTLMLPNLLKTGLTANFHSITDNG